jgi:hypothetical protein
MSARAALGYAVRDLYEHSWQLLLVNTGLGLALVLLVLAALAFPPTAILLVLAGPVLAALVHCTVTVVRTGSFHFADAWEGLRVHWLHGLELAFGGVLLLALGTLAVRFYGGSGLWPLAFLALYALIVGGAFQLLLWTLVVAEPKRPLRDSARDASVLLGSRPGSSIALGLVLLLVNLAGVAAAVMPFLTLTVAYTFLATARFALPQEEAGD